MKTVAVINQKGGVGKTTITANLAHALALKGLKVTVMDLDPQGHLSASLGIFKAPAHGIADVLAGVKTLEAVRIDTRESLHLIPSGRNLAELEQKQGDLKQRMYLLKQVLNEQPLGQDYLLLDCPPTSGLLAANAILASDEVIMPVNGDYLSLNGLAHLMITLKRFDKLRDQPLKRWILLSRFVKQRKLSREVLEKLQQYFPGLIINTAIREASALSECPGKGRTIFEIHVTSSAAADFRHLADDLMTGNSL